MAIYHLEAKVISRSDGGDAVRKAAYNARAFLTNERTGEQHDYRRKGGLLFSGIYLPAGSPDWANDRARLWSAAELAEKRSDSTIARHYIVALPHELTDEQRRWLVQDFVKENFTRKGYAADVCIHAPDDDGDDRNYHAHILVSDRRMTADGFAGDKKERQLKAAERKAELLALRQSWEKIGNRHLARHGHAPTLDHRTLEAQGIDREPTKHVGVHAMAMERKGQRTERGAAKDAIEARNGLRAEIAALKDKQRRADRHLTRLEALELEQAARQAATHYAADAKPERGTSQDAIDRLAELAAEQAKSGAPPPEHDAEAERIRQEDEAFWRMRRKQAQEQEQDLNQEGGLRR